MHSLALRVQRHTIYIPKLHEIVAHLNGIQTTNDTCDSNPFQLQSFEEVTIVPSCKWKCLQLHCTIFQIIVCIPCIVCMNAPEVYFIDRCIEHIEMKLPNKFSHLCQIESCIYACIHAYFIRIHLLFVHSYILPFCIWTMILWWYFELNRNNKWTCVM